MWPYMGSRFEGLNTQSEKVLKYLCGNISFLRPFSHSWTVMHDLRKWTYYLNLKLLWKLNRNWLFYIGSHFEVTHFSSTIIFDNLLFCSMLGILSCYRNITEDTQHRAKWSSCKFINYSCGRKMSNLKVYNSVLNNKMDNSPKLIANRVPVRAYNFNKR